MPRTAAKKKTSKPYPDFPLYLHRTGQWSKKIRGRTFYFGCDADAALTKYLDQRDDLMAGRTPRVQGGGLTVAGLVNRFLTQKKSLVDSGELSPLTFQGHYIVGERLCAAFGKTRLVSDLAADDFERLRASFSTGRALLAVRDLVVRTKGIFKYADEAGLIDRPIRFGPGFVAPAKAKMRKGRQAKPARMYEAAELRSLIDTAEQPMRVMILLAINCGFGQNDLANLPKSAIDLDSGWVNYPRPKTAIPRRCLLWSETLEALRQAIKDRPAAKDAADAGLTFLTAAGVRWVRFGEKSLTDGIGREFKKLLKQLKLQREGRGFYALRHSFATVAGESRDQVAVNAVMGHSGGREDDMPSRYRERIGDDRLKAVAEHVRTWLFYGTSVVEKVDQ